MAASRLVRNHVWISGRVQGVAFRASLDRVAQRLGLRGWVRNLPDGRVEAVFQGEARCVEEATRWSRHGPPAARVSAFEVRAEPPEEDEREFEIV